MAFTVPRRALLPIAAMILICISILPLQSGEIWGNVFEPDGQYFYHVAVSANIAGDNTSGHGMGEAIQQPPDWLYWIPNLSGGTYSLGCAERDFYIRQYFHPLTVPSSGSVGKHFNYKPNAYIGGTTYFGPGCSEYRQSFRATGSSVIAVALREAAGVNMRVTIHQGDVEPLGPQIGPARVIPSSSVNGRAGYWSAGDVPTTPGQLYTVKIVANSPSGIWPFIETIAKNGAMRIPAGQSWRQGQIVLQAPELVVSSDDDGIITTVCTARHYGTTWGNIVGQSFKAKGRSVVGVTFQSGTDKVYAVSVHNGVGSGQGGPQIGPTKYVKAIAWNNRSMVTWAPGEVMVTPGNTYYVKFRHLDNSGVTLYTTEGDPIGSNLYADGQLYKDGAAVPATDLSITIMEEESAGSINKPFNSISNLNITTTPTTATVTWTTSPPLRGRVEWAKYPSPLSNSITESTASSSHSVTITGLEPNTMYSYQVSGSASGYRENITEGAVFCTQPLPGTNLLTNPGFETGTVSGWTKFGTSNIDIRNYPAGGSSSYFGVKARSGNYFLGGAGNPTQVLGGVYQRVDATPGTKVKASMWLWTHTVGNFKSEDAQTWGRIGIDPTGGTNVNSSNIIWTMRSSAQQKYINIGVEATASSNRVTVFCQAGILGTSGYTWTVFAIDDVVLTGAVNYTDMSMTQAKAAADGTHVRLTGPLVSATSTDAGAYYVQQQNRACGIRIESTNAALEGETVTVVGTLATKSSGERFLSSAQFTSRSGNTPPDAMGTKASSIGGLTLGVNNVGLLMSAWGEVKAAGSGYVMVNDGSLPGNGLKVITSSLTNPPAIGTKIAVTGITQLEGSVASPVVVLRPRRQSDIAIYQ